MSNSRTRTINNGLIDIQIYFPKYYVDQNELEVHDKIDKGKYTIGLGQQKMAFVGDREDINSICLTV
jgi:hydroxymethylglutaryl-CoA synthase